MILATWQQERALETELFVWETTLVFQLPDPHLGRTCYSGCAIGRVYVSIFSGKLLNAFFDGFASAFWQKRYQQTWDMITAFSIQRLKF